MWLWGDLNLLFSDIFGWPFIAPTFWLTVITIKLWFVVRGHICPSGHSFAVSAQCLNECNRLCSTTETCQILYTRVAFFISEYRFQFHFRFGIWDSTWLATQMYFLSGEGGDCWHPKNPLCEFEGVYFHVENSVCSHTVLFSSTTSSVGERNRGWKHFIHPSIAPSTMNRIMFSLKCLPEISSTVETANCGVLIAT